MGQFLDHDGNAMWALLFVVGIFAGFAAHEPEPRELTLADIQYRERAEQTRLEIEREYREWQERRRLCDTEEVVCEWEESDRSWWEIFG